MPSNNRFTIYDALDKAEYFSSNPANPASRSKTDGLPLYTGPVEYPKMLYHPEGEEKVIVPAEIISTPMGAKMVGEQRELIHEIVENKAAEDELVAQGWHDHPAKAVRARIEALIAVSDFSEKETKALLAKIPVMSSSTRIAELEAEIARLTKSRDSEQVKKAEEVPATRTPKATPQPTATA